MWPSVTPGGHFFDFHGYLLFVKNNDNMACACKNKNRVANTAPTRRTTPSSNGKMTSRRPNTGNTGRKTIIRRIGH